MALALAYLLVFQKQEVGEGRVSCPDIFNKLAFEFSVPNNLGIDCVAGTFAQLLNLV